MFLSSHKIVLRPTVALAVFSSSSCVFFFQTLDVIIDVCAATWGVTPVYILQNYTTLTLAGGHGNGDMTQIQIEEAEE